MRRDRNVVEHGLVFRLQQFLAEKIVTDLPYQRGSTWGHDDQVRLFDSMLASIPVGIITFNLRPDNSLAAVDGKQRVEAVRSWFAGALALPAEWFNHEDIADSGEGKTLVCRNDLTGSGQGWIERLSLVCSQAQLHPDDEPALFERINWSGVTMSDEDRGRASSLARSDGTFSRPGVRG